MSRLPQAGIKMPVKSSRPLLPVLWLVLCPAALWSAEPAPTNPPEGKFFDEWYVLMLGGQQAGYMHSIMERKGDRIHTTEQLRLTLARAGTEIELSFDTTGTETLDGKPLCFEGKTKMATMEMVTRGRIENGKAYVEVTQFGVTTKSEYDLPSSALMTWGAKLATLEHGLAAGTEYAIDTYLPSQNPAAPITVHVKVEGPETIDLFGEAVKAIKMTQVAEIMGGRMESTSWVDKEVNTLRADQNVMGYTMSVLRADRARALSRAGPSEVFMTTLIKPDRPIDRDKSRRVKYHLRLKDGSDALKDLPTTDMQKVVRKSPGSVELVIQRQDHKGLARKSGPLGKVPADMEEYLAPGPMINCKDPEIMKMAEQAAGKETNAYRLARALCLYVAGVIDEKTLDVGFASASEVARNHEGDCSEHSVLLAALGRARGIPSRVVAGLVYVDSFQGETGVFGFHMWTQMYVNGAWVDLDAAQDEIDCNPTHIAVATSSLQEEGLMELAGPLLNIIANLEIEVLEVKP